MYSCSRGVFAPRVLARCTKSQPFPKATGPVRPAKRLPIAVVASPQYAIAQLGSSCATAANVFAASPNENECSIATASSNGCWTLAWQETGKCTSPHCPAALAGRVGRAAADANRPAIRAVYRTLRFGFMVELLRG